MRVLRTPNTYHRLTVKLYKFLSRRTNSMVNSLILRRLMNSRVNRAPISIARLAKFAQRKSYSTVTKA
jgi:large subunit ribosomal protein L18e